MKNKEKYLHHLMHNDLQNYFTQVTFQKGDIILKQGQSLKYLYILVKGKAKACHTTVNGITTLHSFLEPINVFGEVEFLNQFDILNDIYAIEESACFAIDVEQYRDIILNDILFMRYLAKSISLKLYYSEHNTSISMNYSVESRLASYLVSCEKHCIIQENFVLVAERIGCSYRQLHRVLKHFCALNYLKKVKKGQYHIMDIDALKKLGQDLYHLS